MIIVVEQQSRRITKTAHAVEVVAVSSKSRTSKCCITTVVVETKKKFPVPGVSVLFT